MLVGPVIVVGVLAVRVLTAVPGYGRTRRGTIALQVFSRITLRALGIRVVSKGAARSGPSLVVANHVCWVDVLVLAAAVPIVPVVDEVVAQRPMIGPIATRLGALFVRGGRCRGLPATVQQVTRTLRAGHRVLVFPECRSGQLSGHGPVVAREPFSRATFQAAVDAAAVISPVALSYSSAPARSTVPDDVLDSLWRILRTGPMTVQATWLPVIAAVAGPGHRSGHREAAARRTEWAIDRALGRRTPTRTAPPPAAVPEVLPALALAS